jgi:hypothetical protein
MLGGPLAGHPFAFFGVSPIFHWAVHCTSPIIGCPYRDRANALCGTRVPSPKLLTRTRNFGRSRAIRVVSRPDRGKMSRAEEYKWYAVECVRVAQQTQNPNDKAMLLDMARKWQELADKAEREQ